MSFNIDVVNLSGRDDIFRIRVSIGDVIAFSPPGSISDNFRDLEANRHFLANGQLAKIFFGEEPLVNLSYNDGIKITAYIFKKGERGSERLSGEFQLAEALSQIDEAIGYLRRRMETENRDVQALLKQVEDDIMHGIYGIYLND